MIFERDECVFSVYVFSVWEQSNLGRPEVKTVLSNSPASFRMLHFN